MTPRELAAAIRKGAKLRPQGFGSPTSRRGDGTSCALQAGAEGISGRLEATTMRCQKTLGITTELAHDIYRRNDCGRYTREQIADWLDTLEPAHRQTFDNFMAATLKHVETELTAAHPAER